MSSPTNMESRSEFAVSESLVPVISVQGERQTRHAGSGSPASRIRRATANVIPPPAESPTIAIDRGSIPFESNHR